MPPKEIPDRWEPYIPIGSPVRGTRFIALKVPLKEHICAKLNPKFRWTINILTDTYPDIGMIVDLTLTTRYYDFVDVLNKGVDYCKVAIPGQQIPSESLVKRFFAAVDFYLDRRRDDSLIGVHCTHGVNRTGYMIARYMIQRLGFSVSDALESITVARGHPIERENYISDLGRHLEQLPKILDGSDIHKGRTAGEPPRVSLGIKATKKKKPLETRTGKDTVKRHGPARNDNRGDNEGEWKKPRRNLDPWEPGRGPDGSGDFREERFEGPKFNRRPVKVWENEKAFDEDGGHFMDQNFPEPVEERPFHRNQDEELGLGGGDRLPRKRFPDKRGPPSHFREDRGPNSQFRENRGPPFMEERGPQSHFREEREPFPQFREEHGSSHHFRDDRGPSHSFREEIGPPAPFREDRGRPFREERGPPFREERGPPAPFREERGLPYREERGPPPPFREERGPPQHLRNEAGPPPNFRGERDDKRSFNRSRANDFVMEANRAARDKRFDGRGHHQDEHWEDNAPPQPGPMGDRRGFRGRSRSPLQKRRDDYHQGPMPGRRMSPGARQMSPPGRRMSPPSGLGRRMSPPSGPGRRMSPPRRISPPRRMSPGRPVGGPHGRPMGGPPPRRMSPQGRMSPPGRRLSPPGRRMSPPGRRLSSPGRRMSPPARRMSPLGRRMSPPNTRRLTPPPDDRIAAGPFGRLSPQPRGYPAPHPRMSPTRPRRASPPPPQRGMSPHQMRPRGSSPRPRSLEVKQAHPTGPRGDMHPSFHGRPSEPFRRSRSPPPTFKPPVGNFDERGRQPPLGPGRMRRSRSPAKRRSPPRNLSSAKRRGSPLQGRISPPPFKKDSRDQRLGPKERGPFDRLGDFERPDTRPPGPRGSDMPFERVDSARARRDSPVRIRKSPPRFDSRHDGVPIMERDSRDFEELRSSVEPFQRPMINPRGNEFIPEVQQPFISQRGRSPIHPRGGRSSPQMMTDKYPVREDSRNRRSPDHRALKDKEFPPRRNEGDSFQPRMGREQFRSPAHSPLRKGRILDGQNRERGPRGLSREDRSSGRSKSSNIERGDERRGDGPPRRLGFGASDGNFPQEPLPVHHSERPRFNDKEGNIPRGDRYRDDSPPSHYKQRNSQRSTSPLGSTLMKPPVDFSPRRKRSSSPGFPEINDKGWDAEMEQDCRELILQKRISSVTRSISGVSNSSITQRIDALDDVIVIDDSSDPELSRPPSRSRPRPVSSRLSPKLERSDKSRSPRSKKPVFERLDEKKPPVFERLEVPRRPASKGSPRKPRGVPPRRRH